MDSKFIPITDCLVGSQSRAASTDQRLNRPQIAPPATRVLQQPGLQAGGLPGSLRVRGPGWRGCQAACGSRGQAGRCPFDLLCTPARLSVTLESVQRLSHGSSFPGLRVSMRDVGMCVSTHQCMLEQEARGGCSDEGKTSQLFMAVRAETQIRMAPPAGSRSCLCSVLVVGQLWPCSVSSRCGPRAEGAPVTRLSHSRRRAPGPSRPVLGAGLGPLSPSLATASCVTKPAVQGMGGRRLAFKDNARDTPQVQRWRSARLLGKGKRIEGTNHANVPIPSGFQTAVSARVTSGGTNREPAQMGSVLKEEIGLASTIIGCKVAHVARVHSL